MTISSKDLQINESIKDLELRVVGIGGTQLGIMDRASALALAEEQNMDLVKIASGNNQPVVCKIMDYGKHKFEQSKRERETRKNQKVVFIKEVRVTPNIDGGDFNVKVGQAKKFLSSGNKVKITVRFRGREIIHSKLGEAVINNFIEELSEFGSAELRPKLEGKNMFVVFNPIK